MREGDQIVAYSIDRLSIEEPFSKFGETPRGRNFDEMKRIVRELYEARLNRTLWQIVYEFDRERAEAALEYLRQRYGVSEGCLWERHDELYLTWLVFRLADEFEAYLKSGVGRGFKTKEEVAGVVFMPWLPVDLAPLFWLRLVGDPEGGAEFRNAWVTAVNMWFERMAEPYTPKKPAVARKAVELFNVFVGAGFKYEELFPPPPPKPEAAKPAQRPEAVKPETAAKPEAVRPEALRPAAEVVERGLSRGSGASVVDIVPEGVLEVVEYLVGRFGVVLDREAAFKASDFVVAKVRACILYTAASTRRPWFPLSPPPWRWQRWVSLGRRCSTCRRRRKRFTRRLEKYLSGLRWRFSVSLSCLLRRWRGCWLGSTNTRPTSS